MQFERVCLDDIKGPSKYMYKIYNLETFFFIIIKVFVLKVFSFSFLYEKRKWLFKCSNVVIINFYMKIKVHNILRYNHSTKFLLQIWFYSAHFSSWLMEMQKCKCYLILKCLTQNFVFDNTSKYRTCVEN